MSATNKHAWVDRLTPAPQGIGGFDACWYPVAMSQEVARGAIHKAAFLDGHVIVVRATSGEVSVLSPYCRHYGADLADGDLEDGCQVRCPFHHWKFNLEGQCVGTGVGDPVPSDTALFRFPTEEKWGLIWAFNGLEPTYDAPSWDEKEEERHFTVILAADYRGDPFLSTMNVIDTQHLRALHGLNVHDLEMRAEGISFHTDMTISSDYAGLPTTTRHAQLIGPNTVVYSKASTGIDTLASAVPYGPGRSRLYIVTGGLRSMVPPSEIAEKVATRENASREIVLQDLMILDHIRFRPDRASKSDVASHQFLRFCVDFPRAHPSKDFIT